jgi:hypothetical protein
MNPTPAIESISGTFVANKVTTTYFLRESEFRTERRSARGGFPVWLSWRDFEENIESLMRKLSLAYLIGALGFGGILILDALSH